ncbi:MAG: NAD(P)H-dependent oxidoreductase [Rhizobiaceae bacterium]
MTARNVLIVIGHPDPSPGRLCRALADAYAEGARNAGHAVRTLDLATLEVPMLRSGTEFLDGKVPEALADASAAIGAASHIVFVFPLWLGTMPALMKAFLEQTMRPGIAFAYPENGKGMVKTLLKGRTARVVVTMGMPAFFYRLWFLSHGVAGLRRSILNFVGIRPVRETFFGMVEGASPARRAAWLETMRALGTRAA